MVAVRLFLRLLRRQPSVTPVADALAASRRFDELVIGAAARKLLADLGLAGARRTGTVTEDLLTKPRKDEKSEA